MRDIAKHLAESYPDQSGGWMHWAFALREMEKVKEAKDVALQGLERYTDCRSVVHFDRRPTVCQNLNPQSTFQVKPYPVCHQSFEYALYKHQVTEVNEQPHPSNHRLKVTPMSFKTIPVLPNNGIYL